ncbi:unnamed protein product, partial [Mesorhabditis belari]|uniref:Uncharacterized protein n=1 Tax=Mesorhabditis belari TaxID=2138241 RepID=A0AAF3F0N9_9BILA
MDLEPGTSTLNEKRSNSKETSTSSDYFHVPVNTDNDILGCCLAGFLALGTVLCASGCDQKSAKCMIFLLLLGFGLISCCILIILGAYILPHHLLKPKHFNETESFADPGNFTGN